VSAKPARSAANSYRSFSDGSARMLIRAVRVTWPLGGLPPLFLILMPELYLQIFANQPDFLILLAV
jgi:hypothetical protein